MSSYYRLDYASTSPRTFCSNCGLVIRSGDIRFTAFQTYRHLDCVTNLEVLKLWQHCKSFENVPGFSSLEYPDRSQVQMLFKTLLLSTPVQSQGMMRAKLIAAAASATAINQPMQTGSPTIRPTQTPQTVAPAHPLPSVFNSDTLQRTPSNDMVMESCSSSPTIVPTICTNIGNDVSSTSPFNMALSPDMPFQSHSSAISSASSHELPRSAPTLSSTPSALASYMSTLSCSTPTHAHNRQLSGHSPTPFFHNSSSAVATPTSSINSPARPSLQHSHQPLSHSPGHISLVRDRSVSPFDGVTFGLSSVAPLINTPSSNNFPSHSHPIQPLSPHSNHVSPVPFASHPHPHSQTTFGLGLSSPHTPTQSMNPHLPLNNSIRQPTATRVGKRKIEYATIPEEENHQQQQPNNAAVDHDSMMDGIEEDDDSLQSHASKKRRTFVRPVR